MTKPYSTSLCAYLKSIFTWGNNLASNKDIYFPIVGANISVKCPSIV